MSYDVTAGFPNKNDPSSTTSRHQSKKTVSILMVVIITVLMVDMTFSTFSDILKEQSVSSFWRLVLFITTILTIYGAGQYFLLGFLKQISSGVRSKESYFNKLYNLLTIAQYIIAGILLLIIFQILLTSHYYIVSTIAATTISYALACIIMSLVSYRFFSWYKSSKDNTVLLYALASAMVAISTGSHLLTHNAILLEKPFVIDANLKQDFPEISQSTIGIIANVFLYANVLPLLLSFVLMYAGTILLLQHHSEKLGKIKFWIIICLPLISFLAGLLPTLLALPSGGFTFYNKNFVVFRVLSILSGTSGSILIGIAFLAIARTVCKIHQNSTMVDYLAIAGYGVMMLAISIETPMYQAPYPPFGVAASASIGLMCYLYGIGIYLSAISVSEDVKLRHAIRQYVIKESKLLDSIGTAEMEQQIEKTILKITKEQEGVLTEQTGVEPSLTEGEVKDYVETVLSEVKQMHNNYKEQQ
ncbi:MAG: hypothetical protein JO327_06340 [Nitrososphaeraceae archaeon]|nr:hypothetical protein [Nitrososphaeraceae archaeon]